MNALSNIIDPEAKQSGIFPPPPPQQHPKGPRSQHRPDARAASSAPYPPGGEKLAATNERPRRRLTPASRRAALPGDPGGSAFSPLPRCALPRRRAAPRALYRARARSSRSSTSPRAAVGSRGGRAGAPSCALASPLPPHSAPRSPPSSSSSTAPQANFPSLPASLPPVIRLGSSRAAPHRGLLPSHPLAVPTITGPRKNVDHTPVRFLRYRLLMQGKPDSGEGWRTAWNP